MLAALDRHLKVLDYKYSIIRTIVNARGKNKTSSLARKREETEVASALTSEEEIFWTAKTLGNSSRGVLSETMWWKATEGSKC